MLDGYCHRIETEDIDDLTFDYEDGWKDMMEDAQADIAARVAELKARS